MSSTEPPKPLTPEARRRGDDAFAPGLAVTLADGNAWELAPPRLGLRFARDERGRTVVCAAGPGEFDDALDRYLDAEDPVEQMAAMADCAYELLRQNYDLTFEEAGWSLFRRPMAGAPGHEASAAAWLEIAAWVVGQRPKPSPAGSGPASEPTGSTPTG